MTDTVSVRTNKTRYAEGSTVAVTADFRASGAANTPTTVHYRLDNLNSGEKIIDWTSVSASSQVSISIPGTSNVCEFGHSLRERFQVLVQADRGLSTQYTGKAEWITENVRGIS